MLVSLLRALVLFTAFAALGYPVRAQNEAGPTAGVIKVLLEKFQAERSEALDAKFSKDTLARADESARRAEAALTDGDLRGAARHVRDARWQVPYLPSTLPKNITRVLGESRLRHADRVNAIAYSPNGAKLVTASRDGTAKVWDLGNGREILTYRGHRESPVDPKAQANVLRVSDVAFSPDGKSIASVCENELHVWNAVTGKATSQITRKDNPEKPFKALAWSPDGQSVAAGGDDQVVRVYHLEAEKPTFVSSPQAGRIEGLAFAPNGKLIASVNNVGQLTVYCPGAANPISLGTPVSNTGEAYDVAFTADSSGLLTAGKDARAKLTAGPKSDGQNDGNTAQTLREYLGHTEAVRSLDVSPDGKTMVTGSADRTVRVWDVTSGKQVRSFQGHIAEVVAVALRPDSRQVASAAEDGTIRLWELSTNDDHRSLLDATDSLWAIAYSPNGKRVATAGADRVVRIYSASTGKLEASLPPQIAAVTSLVFVTNDRLAVAGGDRVVRVWDLASAKALKELTGHESAVLALSGTPDGKILVSGSADRTVRAWNPGSGQVLWTHTLKSAVCSVAVRKDGKFVAVGAADGSLILLEPTGPSPRETANISGHLAGVSGVAFDPNGLRLATCGGDGLVRIWNVNDAGGLSPLMKFEGQVKPGTASGYSPVTSVTFSPDGRFLASCGADQIVHVWDVQTKGETRGLRAHTDWVTSVAFSPDGRFLASAGVDKAARIFELTQQDTAPPPGHTQTVRAVTVSPDGKFAATASTDRTIKVWELATGREVATLLGSSEKIYAISFLGQDKIVTGGEMPNGDAGRVQFWSIKPPKTLTGTQTGRAWAVLGAADGSRVVAWTTKPAVGEQSNHSYELFDVDGANIGSLRDAGREVQAATFTPDLSWVLSGDKQGSIRIWDLATKERVGGDWPLFVQGIADLGVTPDKKTLVAVDNTGTVKVGDIKNRETLGSASAHKGGINGVVVSPKGDTFFTIGADGELKAWSIKDVKTIRTWKSPVTVWGAAYTPDGKNLVTANGDGTSYVLEMP